MHFSVKVMNEKCFKKYKASTVKPMPFKKTNAMAHIRRQAQSPDEVIMHIGK